MKKRNSFIVRVIDNFEQMLQIIAIGAAAVLPFRFDFKAVVEIKQPGMKLQELVIYYALRHGNLCISIVLIALMMALFHKINANQILNKGNRYHRRSMVGYWICSKVLGYNKCSLTRVPIADQFKLILSDLFNEYIREDCEEAPDDEIMIRKIGQPTCDFLLIGNQSDEFKIEGNRLYIAISDTYPITDDMLPQQCNEHNTLIVQRKNNKSDRTRYKSKALVKKVLNVVRMAGDELEISIFPTTNVNNTYELATKVFKNGGQDNIQHLYVHPQLHETPNDWSFSEYGIKIF